MWKAGSSLRWCSTVLYLEVFRDHTEEENVRTLLFVLLSPQSKFFMLKGRGGIFRHSGTEHLKHHAQEKLEAMTCKRKTQALGATPLIVRGVKGARKCSRNWLLCTFLREVLDFKIKAWDVQTKKYSREEISVRKYAPSGFCDLIVTSVQVKLVLFFLIFIHGGLQK